MGDLLHGIEITWLQVAWIGILSKTIAQIAQNYAQLFLLEEFCTAEIIILQELRGYNCS